MVAPELAYSVERISGVVAQGVNTCGEPCHLLLIARDLRQDRGDALVVSLLHGDCVEWEYIDDG